MDDKEKQTTQPENKDFVVIREELKNRPINRRKLANSTLISAISAVVFGLVACITFFLLAPVVSGYFEKDNVVEEKPTQIVFPAETEDEEMNPEDMLQEPEPEIDPEEIAHIEVQEIQDIVDGIGFDLEDYQGLYEELRTIAAETEKSMVRVRTVVTDKDWFDNLLEESNEVCGFIIADNGTDTFVVTYNKGMLEADEIYVTFVDESSVHAALKGYDPRTGICVVTVSDKDVSPETKEAVSVANLGSSGSNKLKGALVLAIGSPMGTYGSINHGMVTAYGTKLYVTDNAYKKITTDIYGSRKATGVLINLNGEILGIIDSNYADEGAENLITAIGISELKRPIENMINGVDLIYFGMIGADVPIEARESYDAPKGAFVVSVEMNSPAMIGGIQAGDIITGINGREIASYNEAVTAIRDLQANVEIMVDVSRYTSEGYKSLSYAVVPEILY